MAIDTNQMVDQIAAKAGLNPQSCEMAVGTILSVLQHEAGANAQAIFAKVPGAANLAQTYDVMAPRAAQAGGGGLLGSLVNAVSSRFGEQAQAAVNGVEQLSETGLSPQQLRVAATALIAQLKTAAGPAAVSNALASVPVLKSGLGM